MHYFVLKKIRIPGICYYLSSYSKLNPNSIFIASYLDKFSSHHIAEENLFYEMRFRDKAKTFEVLGITPGMRPSFFSTIRKAKIEAVTPTTIDIKKETNRSIAINKMQNRIADII